MATDDYFYILGKPSLKPEDMNVQFTRDLKTSASLDDTPEEHRGLLINTQREQQPMGDTRSNNDESVLIQIQAD